MGCRNGGRLSDEQNAVPESLADALLFTTICIIGLPVDVHVKDGSIYSGIFHTACVENEYAIVLKSAKMIKKGNREANIASGRLIETLIILSEDLVQVVAKEVLLPAEGISGKAGVDDVGAMAGIATQNVCQETEANVAHPNEFNSEEKNTSCIRHLNPVKNGMFRDPACDNSLEVDHQENPERKQSDLEEEPEFERDQTTNEVQGSRSSFGTCESQKNSSENISEERKMEELQNQTWFEKSAVVKPEDPSHERHTSEETQRSGALSPSASAAATSVTGAASELYLSSSSTSTKVVPPKNANYSRTFKESKLNPRAKVFSPSPVQQRSTTPPAVSTLATMTYLADPSPVVPVANAEPEADINSFAYRSSTPAKFLPHNNVVYGSGRGDLHYSQPIQGHVGSRTQPIRYAGQYNHLQPGPAYVHPNSQNVVAGRLGPLVYMHPVSNDMVTQTTAGLSQASARPLLTPHPVNLLKHQGALQLYVTPPFMANGQQPFAMAGYIPISQPLFPVVGPIPVPGSDSSLSTKFA